MGLDIQALVDRLVRPGCDVFRELGVTRQSNMAVFASGKAVTAIISNLARRRNLRIANAVWDWIDYIGIEKNTFHYNSMISACEKVRDYNKALRLLDEMKEKKVAKNEVTFSSAISACEKCGQWRTALDLLDQMVSHRLNFMDHAKEYILWWVFLMTFVLWSFIEKRGCRSNCHCLQCSH